MLLFQCGEKASLNFQRNISNFIQKQGTLVGQLQRTGFPASPVPGLRFLVAEKLAFQHGSRNCRTVDPHKGLVFAGAGIVQTLCKSFFARTRGPIDQNCGVAAGIALRPGLNGCKLGAFGFYVREAGFR